MEKRMGASLGFLAFAVAVLSGAIVGNPVAAVVGRAVIALFVFYALGRILGWLAGRILAEREDALCQELEEEVQAAGVLPEEAGRSERGAASAEPPELKEGVPTVAAAAGSAAKG